MRQNFTHLFITSASVFLALIFISGSGAAQLVNSGGTIKIEHGASIVCTGNVTNSSGTITNDGKLEVRGSFVNSGTYNSTANEDSLLLTDTGAVTFDPGSSLINYLSMNKTNGGGITLTGSTTVSNSLDLLTGKFSTNPSTAFELIAPASATFSFAAGTEISRKVRRTGWVSETPVMFNSPNMVVTTHSGTAPTSLVVNMVANGDSSATEREVKRTFNFTPTGGSGYTADFTLPYAASELKAI
jgi:hypothetical protein